MIIFFQQKLGLVIFDTTEATSIYIYDSQTSADPEHHRFWIDADGATRALGSYKTLEQAQYVMEQIYANALHYSDSYEMPSQEEVEMALERITTSEGH